MRRLSLVPACAILLAVSAARAQPPEAPAAPGAPRSITLPQAIAAVGGAPDHRVALAQRRAAEADVAAAGAWPATSITVNTSAKTAHLGLVAAVPLPIFGTLGANRAVARAEADVATAQVGSVDLVVRRDVTKAWIELARIEARADLSEQSAKREEELATITKAREDSGDASHAEVVQATAAAKRARAQATVDRTAIFAASAELARILGWDPDLTLHADGGFPPLVDVPGFEELSQARAQHPDARVIAARIDAERARVTEAERARWPRLSLDLESAIDDPTLPGNDYRVGLTFEIPLLGKTSAAVTAAGARRAAAETEHDATMIALDGQIVAAYKRYQGARERVRAVTDDVLPAQREAAALARAAYKEGQGGLVAVLEADRSLADVEADRIEAQAEAAGARADLDWATGGGQ